MENIVELAKNLELLGASPAYIINSLVSDGYLKSSDINKFVAAMAEEDQNIESGFELGEN